VAFWLFSWFSAEAGSAQASRNRKKLKIVHLTFEQISIGGWRRE